jgi:hypothetical protein
VIAESRKEPLSLQSDEGDGENEDDGEHNELYVSNKGQIDYYGESEN